ncbi:BtrH N-terminal domain-containing protein [Vibrio sp. S9_S30]|uniref:BtrH N-terminal domain-containing protein n=1 Tax=Vibrio sp. S9_S30 TaxID=2720226 RepID=UPI0016804FC0|nr:BtrH N-terminal domain-containing protein [Vibrio sp. S9_S30]MBD1555754.1 BtrH N-terminal domain-containing protein [Vibrio sp. S9_S30]
MTRIIQPFETFNGVHCETNATGCLLKQAGVHLSEPMLFGLGEGLGFVYWNMKSMGFPFIGGRLKPGGITRNLAKNLPLEIEFKETSSVKKAWNNVKEALDQGIAVGLQLDCYHLEYFGAKVHFAGHFAAMYGYDDEFAYLVDTSPSHGLVKSKLNNLAMARNEKGPMAAKNLMYTIVPPKTPVDLNKALRTSITNNAHQHINPPIQNLGYKGILKTSQELKKWFKESKNLEYEFTTIAMIMEKAGTGGALFRNMYRDFLEETNSIFGEPKLHQAKTMFEGIAKDWTQVAQCIHEAGENSDEVRLLEACALLESLSEKERQAMSLLADHK